MGLGVTKKHITSAPFPCNVVAHRWDLVCTPDSVDAQGVLWNESLFGKRLC